MRYTLTILIGFVIFIIFECNSQNKIDFAESENTNSLPFNSNNVDINDMLKMEGNPEIIEELFGPDSPFNDYQYSKDSTFYIKEYSKLIWNEKIDSILSHPHTKNSLKSIKMRFGDNIVDINYMHKKYGNPDMNDYWLARYGIVDVIWGWIVTPYQPIRHELACIPECLLKVYRWKLETGEIVEIVYIIKGNELIPFDAWFYEADAMLPE